MKYSWKGPAWCFLVGAVCGGVMASVSLAGPVVSTIGVLAAVAIFFAGMFWLNKELDRSCGDEPECPYDRYN